MAPETSERRMIEVKIDGKAVSVPEGSTILDAARKMGIEALRP
jgi:NADH dehydrogenase/NADH:ubiquinone oxidoreductase subunit G